MINFVRFISFIGFLYLSINANKIGNENELIIYGALALLFQPQMRLIRSSDALTRFKQNQATQIMKFWW